MTDRPSHGTQKRRSDDGALHRLASASLTGTERRGLTAVEPDQDYINRLLEACRGDRPDTAGQVSALMQADANMPPSRIAQVYVPAVARILGERWCSDDASFAEVTIGCARLTRLLRQLELDEPPQMNGDAPHILIVVGEEVYHTLGATVLAGMLRHKGFGTRLWIGAQPSDFEHTFAHSSYDAIFLSASRGEHIEGLRRMVAAIRSHDDATPIVIGGTILETLGADQDIMALTGASHATNDPDEALTLCNLSLTRLAMRPPMPTHPSRRRF